MNTQRPDTPANTTQEDRRVFRMVGLEVDVMIHESSRVTMHFSASRQGTMVHFTLDELRDFTVLLAEMIQRDDLA